MAQEKLDEAIKTIQKQFGKGAIRVMSDSSAAEPVKIISTGNQEINKSLGIGGIPRGRVTEIFGPEGGGKTTLCLQIISEAQKLGGVVAYIDAEQSLDVDYARALGVDVDKMLISQPDTGEDALEIVLTLVQSGCITAVVVDSVAALVPLAVIEGDMGDAHMGLQARMMSQAMQKLISAVKKSECALIFINQIRDKIGIMFGNPETTPGGRALKFYSSLRLDIRRISQIKKGDEVVGQNVKVKSIKNKLSAPYRTVDVELMYGRGFVNQEKKK